MNEKDIAIRNLTKRYQLIREIYKAVDGRAFVDTEFTPITDFLGMDELEALDAHRYFDAEGFFANAGRMFGEEVVSLSHAAIVEIERSITHPSLSTEHFSASVVQHFHASVGTVQTGNNNIANVTQNIGQNFSEILEQLAILKKQFGSLPSEERKEAIEIIDALEVEVKCENPSKGKIKAFFHATRDFAVKTGTELAASTLAKLLESQIGIKS